MFRITLVLLVIFALLPLRMAARTEALVSVPTEAAITQTAGLTLQQRCHGVSLPGHRCAVDLWLAEDMTSPDPRLPTIAAPRDAIWLSALHQLEIPVPPPRFA